MEVKMVYPLLITAGQWGVRKAIKSTLLPVKNLNQGENEVIEEMKNPNSPMMKDVSEWTDEDRHRALNSPSYNQNYYLQNKVQEYNRQQINKNLQQWERDGRIW